MDENLLRYLKSKNINFEMHTHPAVFTVAESKKKSAEIPGVFHTKNLFLKDTKKFYLVCMAAEKRLNLKALEEKISSSGKLKFASEKELKENLNATPGSVSLFGMIYAKNTVLVIDNEILAAEKVGFHPNVNTSTLVLLQDNLMKFLDSVKCEKFFLEL